MRQVLPVIVSAAIVVFAGRALWRALRQTSLHQVLLAMHQIPSAAIASAALLVVSVYGALALYEAIVVRQVKAQASDAVAVLSGLTAAPIGHMLGWGAVSGGAVRYRVYTNAGLRPLTIAKIAMLAAIPYAAGLTFVLGIALVTQADRAGLLLRANPGIARGAGLAILAVHLCYVTLVLRRRQALRLGTLMVTLPPPYLTAIQYAVGTIEVACGCAVLYVLLPSSAHAPPYVVFVAVYVLSILAGLASSVPAGLGAFDGMLIWLLPQVPLAELTACVLVYRFLLELVPLLIGVTLFASYELKSRQLRLSRGACAGEDERPPGADG